MYPAREYFGAPCAGAAQRQLAWSIMMEIVHY